MYVFSQKVMQIFEAALDENAICSTSVISFSEFGVRPARAGAFDLIASFEEMLHDFGFQCTKIDMEIARRSSLLRAKYAGLKTPDALQLAAALELGCQKFVTNDRRLKQITELEIVLLEEI